MNDLELDQMLNAWKAPDAPASMRARLASQLPTPRRRRFLGPRLRWAAGLVLAAGAAAVGATLVQDGVVGSDTGAWDNNLYVRRTWIVHPELAKLIWWSSMQGVSSGFQRVNGKLSGTIGLIDKKTQRRYGYSWTAEPVGAGQYLFTAVPADPATPAPAPRVVGAGSVFDVEMYAAGGVRMYHHLELAAQPLELEDHRTVDEKAEALTLTEPKFFINGQFAFGSGGVAKVSGAGITVDVPGRGQFVLMLDARGDSRFAEAGSANGNTIDFQSGGEQFRIESAAPVATKMPRPVFVYRREVSVNEPSFGAGGAGQRQ